MSNKKVVVMRFVVDNDRQADALINEISDRIGNEYGVPWHSADVADATRDDLAAINEMNQSRW